MGSSSSPAPTLPSRTAEVTGKTTRAEGEPPALVVSRLEGHFGAGWTLVVAFFIETEEGENQPPTGKYLGFEIVR